jgi:hypothetical protein
VRLLAQSQSEIMPETPQNAQASPGACASPALARRLAPVNRRDLAVLLASLALAAFALGWGVGRREPRAEPRIVGTTDATPEDAERWRRYVATAPE